MSHATDTQIRDDVHTAITLLMATSVEIPSWLTDTEDVPVDAS
jgi:hypothetical protein